MTIGRSTRGSAAGTIVETTGVAGIMTTTINGVTEIIETEGIRVTVETGQGMIGRDNGVENALEITIEIEIGVEVIGIVVGVTHGEILLGKISIRVETKDRLALGLK